MSHLQSDAAFKPQQQQSHALDKRFVAAVERAVLSGLGRDVCRLITEYIGTATIYFLQSEIRGTSHPAVRTKTSVMIKTWNPESDLVEPVIQLTGPTTSSTDLKLFAMNNRLYVLTEDSLETIEIHSAAAKRRTANSTDCYRSGFGAVCIPSLSAILISGGTDMNDDKLMSCSMYCGDRDEWSDILPDLPMFTRDHAMCVLTTPLSSADDTQDPGSERYRYEVYVMGGSSSAAQSARNECFRLSITASPTAAATATMIVDKAWTAVSPMLARRRRPALAVCDQKIWAIHGMDGNDQFLTSIERFDPTVTRAVAAPTTPQPSKTAAVSTVLSFTGRPMKNPPEVPLKFMSTEVNAPTIGEWTFLLTAQNVAYARDHFGTAVVSDQIYVVGGLSWHTRTLQGAIYQPAPQLFTTTAHDELLLPPNTTAGGTHHIVPTECFDPTTLQWTIRSGLAFASKCCAATFY